MRITVLFAEDFCVLTVLDRRENRCFTIVNGVLTLSAFLVSSGMFHVGLFVCFITFFTLALFLPAPQFRR